MRYSLNNLPGFGDFALNLEKLFKDSGIWVSTKYISSNAWLICTLNRSNKVIKINCSSGSFAVYIGDVWTTGSTITNQITVLYNSSTNRPITVELFVTNDYVVLYTSVGQYFIIGALENGKKIIGGVSDTTNVGSAFYNMTDNLANNFIVNRFNFNVTDKDGNYYKAPMIFKDNTGLLINSPVLGIDVLSKLPETWGIFIKGNDLILPYLYQSNVYYRSSLLLKNALI